MFGYAKLFRNRWRALAWSAAIVWLAIEVSTPAEHALPQPASVDAGTQ
jgi:hypothetical protein